MFLDGNENGFLDIGELTTETASDGTYRFGAVDALKRNSVAFRTPAGSSRFRFPNAEHFLDCVDNSRPGTLQSRFRSAAKLGYRAIRKFVRRWYRLSRHVRNGVYDAIGDTLLPNTVVFLDQAPFDGVWRNPERRTLTDAGGRYSFSGLGSQIVNVVAEIGTTATLISPKEASSKSPPRSSSPPVLSRHNKPKPWCRPTSTAITSPI